MSPILQDKQFALVWKNAKAWTHTTDVAHDDQHVLRVAHNAFEIATREGVNVTVPVVAALLHELVNLPKNHADSSRSGELCAARAKELLFSLDYSQDITEEIAYAIAVHGFSTGVVPTTVSAKVLQDADRLDAIGAIGIARCFATCGTMQRLLFHPTDPFCVERAPDDKQWGVDHFYRKLLRVSDGLHTETAKQLAAVRTKMMKDFLIQLASELASEISFTGTNQPRL